MPHERYTPWTREEILALLATNDIAVERALLVLYSRQTGDEQRKHSTRQANNKGFTQADAKTMSLMAEKISIGMHLSTEELDWLREQNDPRYASRIGKYAGQLAQEANDRLARRLMMMSPTEL